MLVQTDVRAQVSVDVRADEVIIRNNGFQAQRVFRGAGKAMGSGWMIDDNAGNSYEACNTTCTKVGGVMVCDGYQSGGGSDPALVAGYAQVLQYLADHHGAVVEHDASLDADLVSFPNEEDPYSYFLNVITTEELDGRLLIDYFRVIEVASEGVVGAEYTEAKPRGRTFDFPNDPFYASQWNLDKTNLSLAQWHPFTPQLDRPVRIGVIDSGINASDAGHQGLDGVSSVVHRWVAPTSGYAVPHGLSVVSLLADGAQDGDGPIGLVGSWDGVSCGPQDAVFDRQPVEIYSYNAGDFGPVSYLVADAIGQAIEDGVDIINLSMRMPYSAFVEEMIHKALAANIVVVAAAGNYEPRDRHKVTAFPANIEGVIAVSAARKNKKVSRRAADTGYDLLAPGEDIIVGGPGGIWMNGEGTSFAAPHVVATVALMRAARPDLTPAEIEEVLKATSEGGRKNKGRGDDENDNWWEDDEDEGRDWSWWNDNDWGEDGWGWGNWGGFGKSGGRSEVGGFLDALAALNAVLPRREREFDIDEPHRCRSFGKAGEEASVLALDTELPDNLTVLGNYPNPFNPETRVRYMLPAEAHVVVKVYDAMGREVTTLVDGVQQPGQHEAVFEASRLSSGLYLYRIEAGSQVRTGRMLLLK